MKRFWIVLLSLGLVMAFSMTALAVTPDFTGQYYARGSYINNPSLLDQDAAAGRDSYSYYDQRVRIFFRLKIVDGLTFTTRMDALETIWGLDQGRSNEIGGTSKNKAFNEQSVGFEQAYVTFATGIGKFDVGYKSGTPYGWGTDFMNATGTAPGIKWSNTFGGLTVLADLNKASKGDSDATTGEPNLLQSDVDNDYYDLGATYKFKDGSAGLLLTYFRNAVARSAGGATAALTSAYNFQPYVKVKLGPVELESEAYWMKGEQEADLENLRTTANYDIDAKGLYVNGRFNMGPAYIGGIFLYASGDNPSSPEKEGGMNKTFKYGGNTGPFAGDGFNPVILFGDDYGDYLTTEGAITGAGVIDNRPDNVWMYQIYGGYAVTKKLGLNAKFSILRADEDPVAAGWQSKNYGSELDLHATYKIYDNLSYNLGAAYLWTGDYFKGTNVTAEVKNNYMLTHWINLSF